jgi:hypothetical protein
MLYLAVSDAQAGGNSQVISSFGKNSKNYIISDFIWKRMLNIHPISIGDN